MKNRIGLLVAIFLFTMVLSVSANWNSTKGQDGVTVYYPYSGWTWTEGADGRRVVYPVSGWTWTEGKSGRRIIYPTSGWTWTEDRTGRRIVHPTTGWSWTEGSDGWRVIYPTSGWTWTEGRDGRRIVYPTSGWTWREGPNGRRVACSNTDPYARVEDLLNNLLLGKIPLTDELRPHLYLLVEQMGLDCAGGSYDPELRRAHQLLNLNNFSSARDLFRHLASTGSSEYVRREAAYFVGYCTIKMEDYWQGIQDFRDFLSQYDNSYNSHLVPDALYVLGVLYENVGRRYEASEAYRKCVERFPFTESAKLSQERLAVISGEVNSRTLSRNNDATALRSNPFAVTRTSSARIARVCQFIRSVDKMSGYDEALEKLTSEDRKIGTVQEYLQILSEKKLFQNLHQDSQER